MSLGAAPAWGDACFCACAPGDGCCERGDGVFPVGVFLFIGCFFFFFFFFFVVTAAGG
jgi:hypothetical protein